MRLFFVLIGLATSFSVCAANGKPWTVYPGFYQPGGAGIEVMDLDGDGQQEAVVTGTSNGGFGQGSAKFFAVLARVGDELEITGVARLAEGESFAGDMRLVPGADAAQQFAAPLTLPSSQQVLAVYAGNVPERIAEIPLPVQYRVDGIADVDGDGVLEVFGRNAGYPEVRDFATGNLEWTDSQHTTNAVGAGQLDGDSALELVFGATNSGDSAGYVLDGATHAQQWSWPDGFRGTPVFGNFDTVPTTHEFAIVEPWGMTRVFVTSPFFSPRSDYATGEVQAIAVRDIEGDLVDEIIVGEGQWGSVIAYKPTTWAQTFNHQNPEHGVSAVAVGQLDADPELEVIFGAGLTSSGADLLQVFDAGFDHVQFASIDARGPHSATMVADLDGDGKRELVWATLDTTSIHNGPSLIIADAETGDELRRIDGVMMPWADNPGLRLLTANLDADPALEIVIGSGYTYEGRVRVLDGVTLQEQWTTTLLDVEVVRDVVAFDANGDATLDIAVAAQGRLTVLEGATGVELWRSASVTPTSNETVAVGQIDLDVSPELLFATGNQLYAIDASTHLFERAIAHGAPVLAAATEGNGNDCRIVVYEATRLVRRHCDTGAIDTLREYELTALMVRPLTDSAGMLVVSDGTRIQLLDGSNTLEVSAAVGPSLGWNNLGTVQTTANGIEVYTGDLISTHRFVLNGAIIMRDGFE